MKRHVLPVAMLAVVLLVSVGQTRPATTKPVTWRERVAEFQKAEATRLKESLPKEEKSLTQMRAGTIGGTEGYPSIGSATDFRFASQKIKDERIKSQVEHIAAIRLEVALLESGKGSKQPTLKGRVEVGQIGIVPRVKVNQIIDGDTAVVDLYPASVKAYGGRELMGHEFEPLPALLKSPEISKWIDGRIYDFGKPVSIDRTRTIQTVSGGSKTVFEAHQLTDKEITEE